MKYQVFINQYAADKYFKELNLPHLVVFDLFSFMYKSNSVISKKKDDKRYVLIHYKHVIDQLPLLKIKSRQGIYKILSKLESCGLIKRLDENSSYYTLGDKYNMMSEKASKSTTVDSCELELPPSEPELTVSELELTTGELELHYKVEVEEEINKVDNNIVEKKSISSYSSFKSLDSMSYAIKRIYQVIPETLNDKLSKRFSDHTKEYITRLNVFMNENHKRLLNKSDDDNEEQKQLYLDIQNAVNYKIDEWKDSSMKKHLTPITFARHIEKYIEESKNNVSIGAPKVKNNYVGLTPEEVKRRKTIESM